MRYDHTDIQGLFLGAVPYDFRRPTLSRAVARLYQPGGSMLVPKVFGLGWTLNLAHPGSRWLLATSLLAAAVAAIVA